MIQRQQAIGIVAPCPHCAKQPRYYRVGFHLHMLECAPCGVHTAKHDSAQQAFDQWEALERANALRASA